VSTFLDAANRVLRTNGFIGDNDDDLTTFSTTQHQATLNMAKIAINLTLIELVSSRMIPYEETEATLTYVQGQRNYALANDFIHFSIETTNALPYLVELDASNQATTQYLYEYKGGEQRLRLTIHNYRVIEGNPIWWYWVNGTTKQIGFYMIPDASKAGIKLRYSYEKDVSVSGEGDQMPFTNSMEFDMFANMAARSMKYMFENLSLPGLESDIIYSSSKAALIDLLRPKAPATRYGHVYR